MPRRRFPDNRRNRNNPENRDSRNDRNSPENRDSRNDGNSPENRDSRNDRNSPEYRGSRNDRNNPESWDDGDGFFEYFREAMGGMRDERDDRRAYRDAYFREEAEDRRLDRDIRGDRYFEVDREELLDQRDDRRQRRAIDREELLDQRDDRQEEREIGDRVRLQRTALFGGIFASEEDRQFRKIKEREARERKLGQYQQLIQQCEDRIKEYHMMEDWLDEIRRSDFNSDTIEQVRSEVREQKLQLLTRRSENDLLTGQGNWNAEERRVLKNLTELTAFEESVYDDVLIACDTAELKNLESAQQTVRFCGSQAGEVLKRIPQLAAGQKRSYDNSDANQSVMRFGLMGLKYSGLVAPLMFIVGCVAGSGFAVGQGFGAALLTVLIGGGAGAAIGYFKWKGGSGDDLDLSR